MWEGGGSDSASCPITPKVPQDHAVYLDGWTQYAKRPCYYAVSAVVS